MFVILLVSLAAGASAAPHYPHYPLRLDTYNNIPYHLRHVYPSSAEYTKTKNYNNNVNTANVWEKIKADIISMNQQNNLDRFQEHFPAIAFSAGLMGNKYQVRMTLPGFDQNEIVVRTRPGSLQVKAVHKSEDGYTEKNYFDVIPLPPYVETYIQSTTGIWSYDGYVLTVAFPVNMNLLPTTARSINTGSCQTVGGKVYTTSTSERPVEHATSKTTTTEAPRFYDIDIRNEEDDDKQSEIRTSSTTWRSMSTTTEPREPRVTSRQYPQGTSSTTEYTRWRANPTTAGRYPSWRQQLDATTEDAIYDPVHYKK